MTARPWQGPGPNPMGGAGGRRRVPQPPGKGPGGAVGRAAPGLQRGIANRFNRGMGRGPGPARPAGAGGGLSNIMRGQQSRATRVAAAQKTGNDPRLRTPGRGPVTPAGPVRQAAPMQQRQTAFGQAMGRPGAAPRGPMKTAAPMQRRAPVARPRPPARNRGRGGKGPWA